MPVTVARIASLILDSCRITGRKHNQVCTIRVANFMKSLSQLSDWTIVTPDVTSRRELGRIVQRIFNFASAIHRWSVTERVGSGYLRGRPVRNGGWHRPKV